MDSTGEAYIYNLHQITTIVETNSSGNSSSFISTTSEEWLLNTTLVSVAGTDGRFGYSVGIHQFYAIVGAYGYGVLFLSFIPLTIEYNGLKFNSLQSFGSTA